MELTLGLFTYGHGLDWRLLDWICYAWLVEYILQPGVGILILLDIFLVSWADIDRPHRDLHTLNWFHLLYGSLLLQN